MTKYILFTIVAFNFSFSNGWAPVTTQPMDDAQPAITARLVKFPQGFDFKQGASQRTHLLEKVTPDIGKALTLEKKPQGDLRVDQLTPEDSHLVLHMKDGEDENYTARFSWEQGGELTEIASFNTVLRNEKALFAQYYVNFKTCADYNDESATGSTPRPASVLLKIYDPTDKNGDLFLFFSCNGQDVRATDGTGVVLEDLAEVNVIDVSCGNQHYHFLREPLKRHLGGRCCGLAPQGYTGNQPFSIGHNASEETTRLLSSGQEDHGIRDISLDLYRGYEDRSPGDQRVDLLFQKESTCTIL